MANFEFVTKYKDCGLDLPIRKTEKSAGYDLCSATDIIIPSYRQVMSALLEEAKYKYYTLEEMADLTKATGARPTLISTGLKCKLDEGTYLELTMRSSSPLKYWLVMANGVGVIDGDYYNNPDNEGEIFLQVINLSPYPIKIQKGDAIGQGIIKPYLVTNKDCANGSRIGGFGSTTTHGENSK